MWLHLSFLTIATLITWLWTTTETLNFYTLQLIAVLILLYFIKNMKKMANDKWLRINQWTDATILTLVVLLLVFSTGGLSSPLFFLIYFLLFGLSFLFEPKLAISFSFILLIFLLPGVSSSQDILKLFSLVLVAPLALFFGQQYLQNLANQNRIKIFKNKWVTSEKSLENQETNALMWLSLNFKSSLAEIIEISANLLSQISSLSSHQQESIRTIKQNAEKLLAQGDGLKSIIDKETDEDSAPAESSR